MRLFASVAVLSLALAASVSAKPVADQPTAQPASNTVVASAEGADKKKDGVICRREIPTGSHFPVKVCTTAEQRKAARTAAQRAQESMQAPGEVIPR